MLSQAPENKSLDPAIRKAQAEFATAPKPIATPKPLPPARKVIGNGTCPRCGMAGEIYAVGEGDNRHLVYERCECKAKGSKGR